jgi:hypothetical protein
MRHPRQRLRSLAGGAVPPLCMPPDAVRLGLGSNAGLFVRVIRGWHMLILRDCGWCLGYLSSGVFADL